MVCSALFLMKGGRTSFSAFLLPACSLNCSGLRSSKYSDHQWSREEDGQVHLGVRQASDEGFLDLLRDQGVLLQERLVFLLDALLLEEQLLVLALHKLQLRLHVVLLSSDRVLRVQPP